MGVTVTDVVTEYGAYYINAGQNEQRMREALYRGSETAADFITIPTDNTQERFGNASISRVLQPFQKAFTQLGTLTVTPSTIQLYQFKIDEQVYPDDIEKSWLGFLGSNSLSRKDWPLVRYMMEKHVLAKKDEDYELNEIYSGVYAAPTPGTAGAASTAMNGIKKLIIDGIADSTVNVVTLGAVPTDAEDFCTYVEEYIANIPHKYRKKFKQVFMSEDHELLYKQGKRKKYNLYYSQEDLTGVADYPNIKVAGRASLGTSDKIWTTLPENMIRFVKKAANGKTWKVEEAKREVATMTDWYEGIGFPYPAHVFTNDQDNS